MQIPSILTEHNIAGLLTSDDGLRAQLDPQGTIIDCNNNAVNFTEYDNLKTKKDVVGRSLYEIIKNYKVVDSYIERNNATFTGKDWLGIDVAIYQDRYSTMLSKRTPVYDIKQEKVVAVFIHALLVEDEALQHLVNQLNYYKQKIDMLSTPLLDFLNQEEPIKLTAREKQCLFHLLHGCTAKEIGQKLNLSPKTAEFYIVHLKEKFDCYKKSDLIAKAIALGYLTKIPYPSKH